MRSLYLIICFVFLTLFNSCTSYASVCEERFENNPEITYNTIITNGTPYYVNGVLSYYLYRNVYYYPYYWNRNVYFMPHKHVMPRNYRYQPRMHHRPYSNLRGHLQRQHRPDSKPFVHRPSTSSIRRGRR